MGMLAAETLPTCLDVEVEPLGGEPGRPRQLDTMVLFAWCGTTSSIASSRRPLVLVRMRQRAQLAHHLPEVAPDSARTSGPYTVMLLSNSGLGQMIEFTSLTGPLA